MILKTGNNGFTFVEVMISIAIVSVGLVAITQTFATILHAFATSEDVITGVFLLEEKIEEFEERNRGENGLQEGMSDGTFSEEEHFTWSSTVVRSEDTESLRQLDVEVVWEAGRRKGTIGIMTYLLKQEEKEEEG